MKSDVARTAAEQDVIAWRKYCVYLTKPGVTAGIKRQMRRRARRMAKHQILQGED